MSQPEHREGACFHCDEPLPPQPVRAEVAGAMRAFCCDGCRAAAQWIRDAQLTDYYTLRSEAADRVGTEPVDYGAWDREDIVAGHARTLDDGAREITVLTDGMRCAACAWLIDKALRQEAGVEDVVANAVTGRVRIRWRPESTPLSRPLERMAKLGYRAYLATGLAREESRRRERNRWILRMGIAGLGAMQAMMFAEALYLDTAGEMPPSTRDFFRWITVMVSAPVVFYSGWPFLEGMWREIRLRRLGMDTLIASSTLLAWGASVVETVRHGVHVWFDAAVMFVFLLLAARMIEQGARKAASAQVDALARARPVLATRETDVEDGREQIPVAQLAVGDIVRIAPGEPVPADGVALDAAAFDEALLTGESTPVHKQAGDAVYAGSLCLEMPARVRVQGLGADTRLSELGRLVEEAQAERPRLAQVADRIAHRFVVGLLVSAVAVYLFWRWHDPARAFEVTLAVLVVSCPCALSLAIPSALAAAHGALSKLGVLGVREDALDRLAETDTVVFDKTGTLTDGAPRIASVEVMDDALGRAEVIAIAQALERDSRHPLARAIAQLGGEGALAASAVRQQPGEGIEGVVEGRSWKLGRAGFAASRIEETGHALWLGDGQTAVARFDLSESLRADAADAVRALRAKGIEVELASGDGVAAVDALADTLGIERRAARQTPEAKLARVRELQAQGRRVAMVGDGINDAPVLAGADVSLAMGEGAALAQRAADLVVTSPRLGRVPQAIAIARRTRAVIRQNLGWATAYNLLALPLAATGHVTPWMAALGMAGSSLLVTLNALRLTRTPDR